MSQGDASGAVAPISSDALREFAGSFATGVVVLTAKDRNGSLFGLTMNAISCVCLDPPTFLACVDKGSATLAPLMETGVFALNILARDQETVSNTFASKNPDKFAEIEHSEGALGVPLITGALAAAEFRVSATVEAGDHVIVLGEAVASRQGEGAPLGYFRGKYADIGS